MLRGKHCRLRRFRSEQFPRIHPLVLTVFQTWEALSAEKKAMRTAR
jgi:hypothetical protein